MTDRLQRIIQSLSQERYFDTFAPDDIILHDMASEMLSKAMPLSALATNIYKCSHCKVELVTVFKNARVS
jgi:hypothetical protein